MPFLPSGFLVVAIAFTSATAAAQSSPPPNGSAPISTAAVAAPAPAPPPPYSLPWQLRAGAVGNVIRLDTSFALYEGPDPANPAEGPVNGSTIASLLTFTYKITPTLAPLVRVGVVRNADPNSNAGTGAAFANPIVGLSGGWRLPANLRLSAVVGAAIPLGMGGGAVPGRDATATAVARGVGARAAMDNALFGVNYFTPLLGADLAWVAHKLTVQAELSLFQSFRARNEFCSDGVTKCAPEATRTNSTAGLHVGYFVIPMLSLGAELRYQRYLSTPGFVTANPAARDTTTVAIGPRFHFKVGQDKWLRPGLSFAIALDKPLSDANYNIVQVDLPVAF